MSRSAPPMPVHTRPGRAAGLGFPARAVGLALGIALAYGAFGGIGWLLSEAGSGPRLFWPPAGVALAAIVRYGRSAIPGLVIGAGALAFAHYTIPAAIVVAGGNVGAAALGAWLIRRHGRTGLTFDRMTDVGFLAVAAVVMATASALIGPLAVLASGRLAWNDIGHEIVTWWLGDVAGAILIAPLLLGSARRRRADTPEQPRLEALITGTGLAVCVVVAVWFTFTPGVLRFPATTACLPLLAIAAVRFGPRGAALANLITAAVVVGIILVAKRPEFNLVLITFLAVASITALSLGVVTAERDSALARLAADIAARVAAESARQSAETERILAEAALDADRKRFAALLEHSHDAIVVMTPDGRAAFVSDAIARIIGRPAMDVPGQSVFDLIHPDDLALVRSTLTYCVDHPGAPGRAEFRVRTAEGLWVWVEAIGTNHLDNPTVGGVVVNIRDVTERREAEDRLRSTRGLLEATGRLARIGGWEYVIPDDRLVWSDQTYRIHDVTPGEYAPTLADSIDFYVPEARPVIRAAIERACAAGEPWNLVLPFVTDGGRRLWVNAIGQAELRDDKPYRLYGTFQDVSEQVESERAVQQSEARYQNLFESAPVAIWEEDLTAVAEWFDSIRAAGVTDLAAHLAANPAQTAVVGRMIRVRDVNRAAVAMNRAADKTDLISNLHRLFTLELLPAFTAELVALWNGERTVRVEGRSARLDGTPADIVLHLRVPEIDGRPDYTQVVVIIIDVTEQKRLEEQFRQSQKLEAIGRLAGGIAHDFNNLLTVINGFAELILADSPPGAGVHDLASHIRDAGGRAADLTRQLLAFSRKHPAGAGPLDLAAAVSGLCPLLTPLLGSTIRMVTRLQPVPLVRVDKGQFEQVVMNLVVNARDAMPSGGTLTLATELIETDAHTSPDLPSGRWVVLSVTDTGTGIREDIQPHLFEPFFTTKELGHGTGLGLSTVYGIVTTVGGHLRFVTASGRGTTFRVYWPASGEHSQKVDVHQPLAEAAKSERTAPRSAERSRAAILLAEDLPAVRTLTAQILTSAGFAVVEAADGEEALRKAAAMPSPPDVLVTDVQMPGMNGRELAAIIRAEWPGVRVLFISGFEPDAQVLPSADDRREAFLPKPFSPEELLLEVQRLVEG